MKLNTWITLMGAVLAFNLPVAPAYAHAEHGKPQFGGVVAEAGEAQFEISGKDGRIVVHASNHGAPVEMGGASGRLTVLAGTVKTEVELKPGGGNRLEGAGALPTGAKLLLQVQQPGKKALQARAVAP